MLDRKAQMQLMVLPALQRSADATCNSVAPHTLQHNWHGSKFFLPLLPLWNRMRYLAQGSKCEMMVADTRGGTVCKPPPRAAAPGHGSTAAQKSWPCWSSQQAPATAGTGQGRPSGQEGVLLLSRRSRRRRRAVHHPHRLRQLALHNLKVHAPPPLLCGWWLRQGRGPGEGPAQRGAAGARQPAQAATWPAASISADSIYISPSSGLLHPWLAGPSSARTCVVLDPLVDGRQQAVGHHHGGRAQVAVGPRPFERDGQVGNLGGARGRWGGVGEIWMEGWGE